MQLEVLLEHVFCIVESDERSHREGEEEREEEKKKYKAKIRGTVWLKETESDK